MLYPNRTDLCQSEFHKYEFLKQENEQCWDRDNCVRCKRCGRGVRKEALREHALIHQLRNVKERAEDREMLIWARNIQEKWGKDFHYDSARLAGEPVPSEEECRALSMATYGDELYPGWQERLDNERT